MQTHRQIAKHKTVLWQIGAAGVLALVGAAAALSSVGDFFAVPRKPIVLSGAPPVAPDKGNGLRDLPLTMAGNTLKTTINWVPAPPPAPPSETIAEAEAAAGGASPTPAAPPPGEWAYLGSIMSGHDRHALVRINGEQRILGVGGKHEDDELVAIEPDYIEVEMGGATHKVELAARTLLAPTEQPKHLPNFPKPPTFAATPNTGGMAMAANQAQIGMRPNPNGPAPTLEQQRAQSAALAAAEAARRNQGNQTGAEPPMIPMDRIDTNERDVAAKTLNDPGASDEDRFRHLAGLGIVPGTPIEAAVNRLKESGIDLSGDNYKRIINALEVNAKGGK